MAGSVVFKHLSQVEYVRDNGLIGEQAWSQVSFDEDHFKTAVQRFQEFAPRGPGVLFLHSYAGHGDYLFNIPESARRPVDARFDGVSRVAAFGALVGSDASVQLADQGYDSAMRYVSLSLSDVMTQAKGSDMPTVVIYFSDHGESPYGDFGHILPV
ncbi:sulfatase-like hydrolase/transferase [Castellaniella sp.]|uniref:sulfatase-like hydrolase/transferase n=1 Tax=Castellaniella sp. TaxID=1955812 RepID=UPI002AFEE700|nr:sulfatase-like hydrolase/transferase [Castellaniella sp.]